MSGGDYPKLFALTVGINLYRNLAYRSLQGCVPDADAVDKYLSEELGVPRAQITSLRDEQASRKAILQAMESFITDPRIKENDPIVIYFAGHGGETRSPHGWASEDGKSQLLIPHDYGEDDDDQIVHGIPDRTFGWLLKQVADKKGNNLTVILDSCYSGSGTREMTERLSARQIHYDFELPPDLDKHIHDKHIVSREFVIAPGFYNSGFKSHVLLAACGSHEVAREVHGRGAFTQALLATLHNRNIQKITYVDLLRLMPILPMQNPQCEGDYRDRIMFDGKIQPHRRILYKTLLDSGRLKINAGIAHGVTPGSKFSIWKDDETYLDRERSLATVIADLIDPLISLVDLNSNDVASLSVIGSSFIAELTESGKLPDLLIYIPRDLQTNVVFEAIVGMQDGLNPSTMNVTLSTADKAHFSVVNEQDGYHFDIHNPEVNQHGLKRLMHSVDHDADALTFRKVFHGIAHYEYHLRCSDNQKKGRCSLGQNVALEIFRVSHFNRTDIPITEGSNFNIQGVGIDITQDEDSWYLFKIRNKSKVNLYPALFYFDSCDLSIRPLYLSPMGKNDLVDSPLKAGQSLTIGYGDGGGVPYVFNIRGSQQMEIGFLKLFLATEYVDFSNVEQDSPLEVHMRSMAYFRPKQTSGWDSVLVPFIVRRRQFPGDIGKGIPSSLSHTEDRLLEHFPDGTSSSRTRTVHSGKRSDSKATQGFVRPVEMNTADAQRSSDRISAEPINMRRWEEAIEVMQQELTQLSTAQEQHSKGLLAMRKRLEALDERTSLTKTL